MSSSSRDGPETLVFGVDAGCLPVLEDLADETPTLASLRSAGAAGPLASQLPPWTPSAWPSTFTGVNPGKHGVYGFLTFEGYDWDVVNRTDVRERAVWETLSERGVSSVVVNVPVTHPPESFDGALVPGYTAPEDPACHPEGLLAELRAELGDYRVYGPALAEVGEAGRIDAYEDLVASRGAAFRYLLEAFDPGFGFVQFQQSDTVFHELPDHETAAERVYRAVDREIGATLERFDPSVVLVVSDHGIGPFDGYEVRANALLRDRGFVETTVDGAGMPSWAEIGRKRLRDGGERAASGAGEGAAGESGDAAGDGAAGGQAGSGGDADLDRSLAERAMAALGAAGLTAQRIGAVLEVLDLDRFVLEHVPADLVRAASERVDFAASTAYVRDRIELGVRLNLAGREPEGVVAPEDYDEVRAAVIEALEAVVTPAGEPVFEAALPREAVFEGPHVEEAPDVVLVPAGFDHYLSATLRDPPLGEPTDAWTHEPEGVVIAAGEGVDESASLSGASIFDVAPTVLATFGVPAAERMDGEVLPVVEAAGRESHPPFEPAGDARTGAAGEASGGASGGEERADGAATDRLRAMGYIE